MMTSTPRSTYWRARRPGVERPGGPPPRRASTASRPMRYVWDTDHASTASRAREASLREELDPGRVALGPCPEVGSLHRPRSEPGIALVGLPLGQKEPSQARLPAIVGQLDGRPLLADCLVDHADELVLARDVRVRRHGRHAKLVGHCPHAEAFQPVASDQTTSGLHDLIESERPAPPRHAAFGRLVHLTNLGLPHPDRWTCGAVRCTVEGRDLLERPGGREQESEERPHASRCAAATHGAEGQPRIHPGLVRPRRRSRLRLAVGRRSHGDAPAHRFDVHPASRTRSDRRRRCFRVARRPISS